MMPEDAGGWASGPVGIGRGIFVTGTDTGVGKTVVTACLARYFFEQGVRVITQKWVSCGDQENISADVLAHLRAMGKNISDVKEFLPHLSPYVFKTASSPHLAARLERRRINEDKIVKSFRFLASWFNIVVVEGTGGALVPFSSKHLMLDIVSRLQLPAVVVVPNKLGAINHACLTTEALKARRIKILGLVFNGGGSTDEKILEDNPRIVRALTREKILGILPWVEENDSQDVLRRCFIPIGRRLCF